MKKEKNLAPFEVIMVVVKKGLAEEAIRLITSNYGNFSLVTMAEGTTDQTAAEFFGFGIQERELVVGLIDTKKSKSTLEILNEHFQFDEAFNGLAITIPIKSATNVMLDMIKNKFKEEKSDGKEK